MRFWGYDSAMEVACFMEQSALLRISPDMQSDEAAILEAFDINRDRINEAAIRAYSVKRADSLVLVKGDFGSP